MSVRKVFHSGKDVTVGNSKTGRHTPNTTHFMLFETIYSI